MVILPFKVTGMFTGIVGLLIIPAASSWPHPGALAPGRQPLAAAPAALVALAPPVCPAAPEQPLHREVKAWDSA